jgi:hypothetical protein
VLQEDALRMVRVLRLLPYLLQLPCMLLRLLCDASCSLLLCLYPAPVLVAENLFLRKQLALYHERNVKPGRATNATRITFVWLGRWFDWRQALVIVQPAIFSTGIDKGFACSGAGNRVLDALHSRRSSEPSFVVWPTRTLHGAKSALPMNSC